MNRPSGGLVVAIGGSSGAIQALQRILSLLPEDFDAIVLVAVHRPYGHKSYLADILRRVSRLKVIEIVDSELLTSAVYVSEPSEHLAIRRNGFHAQLLPDPYRLRRNKSIDELFASVAAAAGPRAVGVLLSGMLSDGSEGLRAIKAAGGTTIAQSPEETECGDMPQNAISAGVVDRVLDTEHIAAYLGRLCERTEPP